MNASTLLEADGRIQSARAHWKYRGKTRPSFATLPLEGQESVWDYPRPPRIEAVLTTLRVETNGKLIAQTRNAVRVCETASAPTYYFPPEDIEVELIDGAANSICEWKGVAQPLDTPGIRGAAWRYVQMFPEFVAIYKWVAFYPNKLDCFIGDDKVAAQPGGYYGGWVTSNMTGPIKGEPGSGGW